MNNHIPTNQPPTRRLSESQRKSSRQLEGFASTNMIAPIQSLSKPDLLDLRAKTQSTLNNSTIVTTLPDKGSRLKEKLKMIDTLLNACNDTPETVIEEVSKLSLENSNKPNIRKKSVADANLEASRVNLSSNLLQAHAIQTPSIDKTTSAGGNNTFKDERQQAKVRMISLDESVRLQDNQRDRIKEEGFNKQLRNLKSNTGHADDLW
ncbi:hypothetical protein BC941DRAFT_237113 [Chlamydoabsidia padenii]|nr:hypothetical protein BC941DRAFT_237113 [Chlamydoabsidia padenii]